MGSQASGASGSSELLSTSGGILSEEVMSEAFALSARALSKGSAGVGSRSLMLRSPKAGMRSASKTYITVCVFNGGGVGGA